VNENLANGVFLCKQVLIVDLTLINYQVVLIEQIIMINFYFFGFNWGL